MYGNRINYMRLIKAGSKLKIPVILTSLGLFVIACRINNSQEQKISFLFRAGPLGLVCGYETFLLEAEYGGPDTTGLCVEDLGDLGYGDVLVVEDQLEDFVL